MKPVLALDIDGTLTRDHNKIPEEVLEKIDSLAKGGWEILFITGRSFVRSASLFKSLSAPFHLAVLNGAQIFRMPRMECIYSQLLSASLFPKIEEACSHFQTGAVVYTGKKESDLCYFRKSYFTEEMQRYLEKRTDLFGEVWVDLKREPLPLEEFAAIKTFGTKELLEKLSSRFKESGVSLDFCILQDRYHLSSCVGLGTRHDVTKGSALEHFVGHLGGSSYVVAAGDDMNDLSMLQVADFKVTMEGAPKELLAIADLVVPAAEERGIVKALEKLEERRWQINS